MQLITGTAEQALEVINQSLYNADKYDEMAKSVSGPLQNFCSGIARFNFKGAQSHNFSFDIPFPFSPEHAVVSLSLGEIFNRHTANNLDYKFGPWKLSYTNDAVRVTGSVYVGDSDGYLRGISYSCVAVPGI
ncbi:hypothetical protein [Parasphingorhabdus sp.]|uniref:hypothetical protein n=1 Tax=Parasphingorhabdus sp. TaxID=2709688 RepID=UPI003BAEFA0D